MHILKLVHNQKYTKWAGNTGKFMFNKIIFSEGDFTPIDVYVSNNSKVFPPNPKKSSVVLESQPATYVPAIGVIEDVLLLSTFDTRERFPSRL